MRLGAANKGRLRARHRGVCCRLRACDSSALGASADFPMKTTKKPFRTFRFHPSTPIEERTTTLSSSIEKKPQSLPAVRGPVGARERKETLLCITITRVRRRASRLVVVVVVVTAFGATA